MEIFWISIILSSILSIIGSVLFGVFSTQDPSSLTRTFFGITSVEFIKSIVWGFAIFAVVILTVISGFIRDIAYPANSPGYFVIETICAGILPACVFLIMVPLRGYYYTPEMLKRFGFVILRFLVVHLLLQFSGFHSSTFPPIIPKPENFTPVEEVSELLKED